MFQSSKAPFNDRFSLDILLDLLKEWKTKHFWIIPKDLSLEFDNLGIDKEKMCFFNTRFILIHEFINARRSILGMP